MSEPNKNGLWDTVINIPVPNHVIICDFCNTDYGSSDAVGGCYLSGHSVCPVCTPDLVASAVKHNEPMPQMAKEGETFRAFVLRLRKAAGW